jgi:hypothetical protein
VEREVGRGGGRERIREGEEKGRRTVVNNKGGGYNDSTTRRVKGDIVVDS